MATICYGWQVRKLPYIMEILPTTCGYSVHGTLQYSMAPTIQLSLGVVRFY